MQRRDWYWPLAAERLRALRTSLATANGRQSFPEFDFAVISMACGAISEPFPAVGRRGPGRVAAHKKRVAGSSFLKNNTRR